MTPLGSIERRLLVACLILAVALAVQKTFARDEVAPARLPFDQFPKAVGDFVQVDDVRLESDVLDILRPTDYLNRAFIGPEGHPIWLFIGYYQSQRQGSAYHSPKNCLPGSGWQFIESSTARVPVDGVSGGSILLNRVLLEKGLVRQLVLYWYQDRGRTIASEYRAKAYLIGDAIMRNRTDGSLVRISSPVRQDVEEAYRDEVMFIQTLAPLLPEYLPN